MITGVIPARGGSKGVPRKNLAELDGRPLIAYTFDAALKSTALDRVIVSTDDEEIAVLGRDSGCEVPFLRPAELARDETPMRDVLEHLSRQVESDVYCLLQPTSPLRTARHVDEAVAIFNERHPDSVVSVVRVPHRYTPDSLMKAEEGMLVPLKGAPAITRRQDKPELYARNGPAVLVLSKDAIRGADLYAGTCLPYIMDLIDSCDVDSQEDLEMAEALIAHRRQTA